MSLAELQRSFWQAVRARGSAPRGLEATFTESARQSAAERLSVYHLAYWQRQVAALASTFPRLRGSLGERQFERWALRYVEQRPALHPCIERLGEGLPDYLAQSGEVAASDLALARLEWAHVECLLAPDTTSLVEPPRQLGARFAECRLELISALVVVQVPLGALGAFDERLALPSLRTEVDVAFFRPRHAVRYVALDEDEAAALALARAGLTVARICEAFASHGDAAPERALAVLMGWFGKRWVARACIDDERVTNAVPSA
jgi:Putative DNA-binding domain